MSEDNSKKYHEEQLKKVRNLQPKTQPTKPKFSAPSPKFNAVRRSGRGR